MAQYNNVNVKLSDSQVDELKSTTKNVTEVTLDYSWVPNKINLGLGQ